MSFVSPFVPLVGFRDDAERRLRQTYIDPLLARFFDARGIKDIPQEIQASEAVTELDFARTGDLSFDYLYKVAMRGVRKRGGTVSYTAYALTFDPELCPYECETTGVRHGYMTLADRPVLYYILLDLPTLIAKLRQHSDLKPSYGRKPRWSQDT